MSYENHHRNQNYLAYTKEVTQIPRLTREEEVSLSALARGGNQSAKDRLIVSNLRLVIKIAGDYTNMGLPMLDLLSEGNIGLMKAIDRYDPSKGKLSTYAACWIKQGIKRGLANQSKTVRVPVHLVDKLSKLNKITSKLATYLEREPTEGEVAEEFGISEKRIRHLKETTHSHVPIDEPVSPDSKLLYSETMSDPGEKNPFQRLVEEDLLSMIPKMMDQLDPRERRIITYRYGLKGGKEKTLEQVGKKFGVTRERIRQIQDQALKKMRNFLKKKEETNYD
jgi:RNA polymerase primary sigma factor